MQLRPEAEAALAAIDIGSNVAFPYVATGRLAAYAVFNRFCCGRYVFPHIASPCSLISFATVCAFSLPANSS
jgi:hypothetical protein